MRVLDVSSLHNGMILGADIIVSQDLVFKKNTVLTDSNIIEIKSSIGGSQKVWIYDLVELKPILLKNNLVAKRYIDFMVTIFQQIFTTSLVDKDSTFKLINLVNNYFYNNRELLYEAVLLRDNHCYTYEHSMNVAMYSLLIGLSEDLSNEEISSLILGGILHDLGKLSISNSILDKPTKLDDTEFKAIKQHPVYGVQLSDDLDCVEERVHSMILQHHEKLDGTGYPYGLTDGKITHLSKVIAVADIFDAVTSQRAYHRKRSVADGIKIVNSDMAKGKIAKDEVYNLVRNLVIYPINSIVVLSNGKSGVVVQDCNTAKPIIMGYDKAIYDLSKRTDLTVVEVL